MMLYLINIEWLKFKKHRSFRTLTILYLLFLPALLLIPGSLPGIKTQMGELSSYYIFPNIFKYGGYLASWLVYVVTGFLGVILITPEIQNKTLRQNIITGLSRGQFITGKIAFVLGIAFFITLYYSIVSLVLGFLNTETVYFSKIMEGRPIVIGIFLQAIAYLSVGLLIGTYVRRTGIALFLFFTFPIIEVFLRHGIHAKYIGGSSILYYPYNVFKDLVPIPFAKTISSLTEEGVSDFFLNWSQAIPFALVYISLILSLTYFKIKKSDL